MELLALVLGLFALVVPLTEPEPLPLPEDEEDPDPLLDPDVDPELGVMAASVGETTLAWPSKSHAVVAFFWLA